jgi:hypothetical protein
MKLIAAQRTNGVLGSIFFSAKPLVTDELGLRSALAKDHWARRATTPRLAVAPPLTPNELDPTITLTDGKIVVTPPAGKHVRAIAVYAKDGALVREAAEVVAKTRPDARFGISPFGIYRPGTPPGITGLDAYAALYCDPVKWMKEGWVDYLAPQLYWPTTRTAQAFDKLVAWWGTLPGPGQSIFVGQDATKVGDPDWPLSEYDAQMKLIAAQRTNGVLGSIFFSAKPLVTDELGLRSALAKDHWARRATTPRLAFAPALAPNELDPTITLTEGTIVVTPPAGKHVRAIAVYAKDGALVRLLPAKDAPATTSLDLSLLEEGGKDRFVITVVDRYGRESEGIVVTTP